MIGYKFRTFDRDNLNVSSLLADEIFAPTMDRLNDPYEGVVDEDYFLFELKTVGRLFRVSIDDEAVLSGVRDLLARRKRQGIFSLASDWNHELLWAHYADGHRGFCIEYDVSYLHRFRTERSYVKEVSYKSSPPVFSVLKTRVNRVEYLIEILAATKSKTWSYEKELRLVFEDAGIVPYDYRALRSVTIGEKADPDSAKTLVSGLAGKSVTVYQEYLNRKRFRIERTELFRFSGTPGRVRFKDVDPMFLDEGFLGIKARHKDLLLRALDYVRQDPYLEEIFSCGFDPNSEAPVVFVNTHIKNDWRPVTQFRFTAKEISSLQIAPRPL